MMMKNVCLQIFACMAVECAVSLSRAVTLVTIGLISDVSENISAKSDASINHCILLFDSEFVLLDVLLKIQNL
jgi:hypothetical protein